MNQHNLEKLFQEKFKDFEPELPEGMWQNIKNELPKNEPKKSYFWYKFFGFVAMFFIGFFLFNSNETETIVNQKNINQRNNQNKTNDFNDDENDNELLLKNETVVNQKNLNQKNNQNKTNDLKNDNELLLKNETLVNHKNLNQKNNQNKINDLKNDNELLLKNQTVVNQKNLNQKNNQIKTNGLNNDEINPITTNNQVIAHPKIIKNNPITNKEIINKNDSNGLKNIEKSEGIVNTNNQKEQKNYIKTSNHILENKENIINDDKSKDKTTTTQITENISTTELIFDNETVNNIENETKNSLKNRWQFYGLIAPIFANNFTDKSNISDYLNTNSKNYYQSISYGAYFQYQITPRLGIRTGIANLNTLQETNNVLYHIEIDNNNSIFNNSSITFSPNNSLDIVAAQELTTKKLYKGTLKQDINFIEIPLELNYLIIDKKLQFNIISGASLLLLSNNNTILRTSDNRIINLKEANNINQKHYSINFGFGASYPVFEKMRFHIQPTFRYQIDTFNQFNNNPYNIGIFSGLSFKF